MKGTFKNLDRTIKANRIKLLERGLRRMKVPLDECQINMRFESAFHRPTKKHYQVYVDGGTYEGTYTVEEI